MKFHFKAMSPLISYVLILAIGFTAISITLIFGKPIIETGLDSITVNEGIQSMKLLDNVIREISKEGVGSLRTIQLQVSGGDYIVNNSTGTLNYTFILVSNLFSESSSKKEGNLQIVIEKPIFKIGLSYSNIIITGDNNEIGKGTNKLCIEKTSISSNKPVVDIRRC